MIRRGPSPERYYILSHQIIEEDLSAEALGVLVYVLSRPDNWQIYPSQLAKKFKCGKDKMTRILKEIRAAGYATFSRYRDESGKLSGSEWVFNDTPQAENPTVVNTPQAEKPAEDNQVVAETQPDQPLTEKPSEAPRNISPQAEKPAPVKPAPVNPPLLNINKQLSTENKLITDKFSADDFALAERIFSKIKQSAPKMKSPDFKKWADDVRLMREQDDLTLPEIWETFLWANCDSFWSANILSTKKLRAKFAQLDAQRRRSNGYQQPNQSGSAVGNIAAANKRRSDQRKAALSGGGAIIDVDGTFVSTDDGLLSPPVG